MTIDDEVKQFVISVRTRVRSYIETPMDRNTSDKSRTALICTLNEILVFKQDRKDVLAAITGLPMPTQNRLSQAHTSVILDEIKDKGSDHIIRHIENTINEEFTKAPFTFRACSLFPWEG